MSATVLTAREAGLKGCAICGKANPAEATQCERCGGALREPSLQPVWAWLIAGLIAYVPANLYPMMRTAYMGREMDSTIVMGAIELAQMGSWGVAAIVFIASVIIPVAKFVAIGYLALAIRNRWPMRGNHRLHLFEVVEFIGRWSMIDVFVVAILSALVQFNIAAVITPGVAAISFALSVIFTMLAALSFDSRLIWRSDDQPAPSLDHPR